MYARLTPIDPNVFNKFKLEKENSLNRFSVDANRGQEKSLNIIAPNKTITREEENRRLRNFNEVPQDFIENRRDSYIEKAPRMLKSINKSNMFDPDMEREKQNVLMQLQLGSFSNKHRNSDRLQENDMSFNRDIPKILASMSPIYQVLPTNSLDSLNSNPRQENEMSFSRDLPKILASMLQVLPINPLSPLSPLSQLIPLNSGKPQERNMSFVEDGTFSNSGKSQENEMSFSRDLPKIISSIFGGLPSIFYKDTFSDKSMEYYRSII
jgi:hypothetical protein